MATAFCVVLLSLNGFLGVKDNDSPLDTGGDHNGSMKAGEDLNWLVSLCPEDASCHLLMGFICSALHSPGLHVRCGIVHYEAGVGVVGLVRK